MHYRRGGSGEVDCIVALAPIHDWKSALPWEPSWKVVWFATGHPPLRDLAGLRGLLLGAKGLYNYATTEPSGSLF